MMTYDENIEQLVVNNKVQHLAYLKSSLKRL